MHNNFGRDELGVAPCELDVRVVGNFCQSLEQIGGLIGGAGEAPEVGGPLERDADHVRSVRLR